MPIYEYRCAHCGELCEFLQKATEEPKTVCPHCKAEGLKKIISSTSFQLKGGGWYVTDFRDSKKPKTTEAKNDAKSPEVDKKTVETKDKSDSSES